MLIAFLGDSLTEGRPGAAFFPLLDRRAEGHRLLNRGRAGDTVGDLLVRLRRQGLDPVDAAFIWVGANDAVIGSWDAVAPASGWSWPERLAWLTGDYQELLEWTRARAKRVACVRPLILEAKGSLWERRAHEVAEAITEVARDAGCGVVDLEPTFAAAAAAGEGPFTLDGVHFTAAGAEVAASAFAAVIQQLEAQHSRPAMEELA